MHRQIQHWQAASLAIEECVKATGVIEGPCLQGQCGSSLCCLGWRRVASNVAGLGGHPDPKIRQPAVADASVGNNDLPCNTSERHAGIQLMMLTTRAWLGKAILPHNEGRPSLAAPVRTACIASPHNYRPAAQHRRTVKLLNGPLNGQAGIGGDDRCGAIDRNAVCEHWHQRARREEAAGMQSEEERCNNARWCGPASALASSSQPQHATPWAAPRCPPHL